MQNFFKYLIFVGLSCCGIMTNVYTLEAQKYYIPQGNLIVNDTGMQVLLDSTWVITKTLRHDEQGIYVISKDIILCGSRPTIEKRWQCPYCYHWWKYGEKCQNKDCPTNQW